MALATAGAAGETGHPARTRALAWAAAACIGGALVIMVVMSLNGPSVSVPRLSHPGAGPPWWHFLGLRGSHVLIPLWAAAALGTAGVAAGLAAVARGARPPVRLLLVAVFGVVALFAVLPPAGSTDTISYGIDGAMVAAGHSPYLMTPDQFAATGARIAVDSPKTWQNSLSDYGPLATATEWAAARLGGSSMARITFWLKAWTALAFAATVLGLDRMLRADPAQRLRGHLLWSANPLVLWEIVAGGHIDGISAAVGLAGIVVLRARRAGPAGRAGEAGRSGAAGSGPAVIPAGRALAAGLLIGAAIAVKSPYVLFAVAAAWALRRQAGALAAFAAGAAAVLVPSYLVAGRPAVTVLFNRGSSVTWDNLYQWFWRPFGVSTYAPAHLVAYAALACAAVAVLTCWRLPARAPAGLPELPAVRVALALSLAWLFLWPFQRPWYDVMAIALLVLYPASRLDWVVLGRLGFAAVTYMDAITLPGGRLLSLQMFEGEWITSAARLLAVLALCWLCVSRRWGWRSRPAEAAPAAPELQPLT